MFMFFSTHFSVFIFSFSAFFGVPSSCQRQLQCPLSNSAVYAVKCITTTTMTTTNNNLDCGWSLKLFLTGMWHSLAALLPLLSLRCSFCLHLSANAHGDSTDSTTRSLCSGSTWRIPRRLLARATITSNAMHSRQVPWADVYFRFACFQLSSGWRSLSVAESECLVLARRSCCCRCHRALLDFVLYARF